MAVKAIDGKELSPVGNLGVPAGTVIIVVCFFLPWIGFHDVSAMAISSDAGTADLALMHLRIPRTSVFARVRALYMIPIIALSTLMVELVIPPGHVGRRGARLGVDAAGATLTSFFVAFGLLFGAKLTYGFWGSLMGALFISVGGLFNEIRNE